MDFIAIYGEAGMIGVVGAMFVYLVVSMSKKSDLQAQTLEDLKIENRGQSETLENIQGMVIKLIERWNKSDDISLRHREDMVSIVSSWTMMGSQISVIDDKQDKINARMELKSDKSVVDVKFQFIQQDLSEIKEMIKEL